MPSPHPKIVGIIIWMERSWSGERYHHGQQQGIAVDRKGPSSTGKRRRRQDMIHHRPTRTCFYRRGSSSSGDSLHRQERAAIDRKGPLAAGDERRSERDPRGPHIIEERTLERRARGAEMSTMMCRDGPYKPRRGGPRFKQERSRLSEAPFLPWGRQTS